MMSPAAESCQKLMTMTVALPGTTTDEVDSKMNLSGCVAIRAVEYVEVESQRGTGVASSARTGTAERAIKSTYPSQDCFKPIATPPRQLVDTTTGNLAPKFLQCLNGANWRDRPTMSVQENLEPGEQVALQAGHRPLCAPPMPPPPV